VSLTQNAEHIRMFRTFTQSCSLCEFNVVRKCKLSGELAAGSLIVCFEKLLAARGIR
jgi:hypothetical protein